MIRVKVYSIATSGTECVLLLEELDGPRLLPIWIGINEGQAIAIKIADIELPRPMTHDLLVNALDTAGFKIDSVVVADLRGQTFFAQVHISHNSSKHTVDSRPSDAIALAVRAKCPIFVEEKVFEKCHTMKKPISEDEVKKLKEEIQSIRPEDIIKGLRDKETKKRRGRAKKEDNEPKGIEEPPEGDEGDSEEQDD